MVYNFRCEYAKIHTYMHKYASKRARMPARTGRIVRKYSAESGKVFPSWRELRRLIRSRLAELSAMVAAGPVPSDRRRMCQGGGWRFAVEPLATFVVCSRCVGCVDRLRKLAARCSACPHLTGVVCGNVCGSRLRMDSLTVCTFASVSVSDVGCKRWRIVCALVAILPG